MLQALRAATVARVGVAVAILLAAGHSAHGGGLLGDLIEGACGRCGAGRKLDDAHRRLKEAVPPYKAVEEGVTHLGRESIVESAGPALAVAIRASRNDAVRAGTSRIPSAMRDRLINFFPSGLLDKVSYRVGQGHELSVQANSIRFGDAAAVTLEDVIVFASNWDAKNNDTLWAHELAHVQQYDRWGLTDFAKRYVRSYRSVENEAYAVQAEYEKLGSITVNETGVSISNKASIPIGFLLQIDDGTWKTWNIEAKATMTYYCNGCVARSFRIKIGTVERGNVEYRLAGGAKYNIKWNSQREMWDIFKQ